MSGRIPDRFVGLPVNFQAWEYLTFLHRPYDRSSEALRNIGYILRDEPEKMSEHIDKGLTMFQKSLLGPGGVHYVR